MKYNKTKIYIIYLKNIYKQIYININNAWNNKIEDMVEKIDRDLFR